ncbi:hypothetical protein Ahy_A06g029147 isoform B [Arachis hypogaea]|uniref:Uncharacterized protein n=1 Tax=Arachis hypogaea TaxID=3818 RepID=A0A445CSE5_ARAHY|nr:hypothetical protein Ahy_A06g029147 isoform B [Arachis hypogaea]
MLFYAYAVRSEIGTEELEELLRKSKKKKIMKNLLHRGVFVANNSFWFPREKGADTRSTKGHYDSFETIPNINLGSDGPLSQEHMDQSSINKPAESMLSLVEESANEPAEENMMVVQFVYHCPKQPLNQKLNQPMCQKLNQPLQSLQVKKLMKKLQKVCYISSRSNPAPEDTAVLMMMARTASYVPK